MERETARSVSSQLAPVDDGRPRPILANGMNQPKSVVVNKPTESKTVTSSSSSGTDMWVTFAGSDYLRFPSDIREFEDFLIARVVMEQHVGGPGKRDLFPGCNLIVKGKMPTASPLFRYLLRVKKAKVDPHDRFAANGQVTYEILPEAGFRDCQPLPWTVGRLRWALCNERIPGYYTASLANDAVNKLFPKETDYVEFKRGAVGNMDDEPVPQSKLVNAPFWDDLQTMSEHYRLQHIINVKIAWPGSVPEIRKMPVAKLRALAAHLSKTPHDLCFYRHSHSYGLGEMTYSHLNMFIEAQKKAGVWNVESPPTQPVHLTAAYLYQWLKEQRLRHGHTAFNKVESVERFKRDHTNDQHSTRCLASLAWLIKERHLLFLNEQAMEISDRSQWFRDNDGPVKYLQLPRDQLLQERILSHLRRIYRNFLNKQGKFSVRSPEGCVPAVPKGVCNPKQKRVIDHVLNNPITIIQGGPGSGKTYTGVVQMSILFEWMEIQTHVGRQAVALCDLLGGSTENASTVHSSFHRRQANTVRREYLLNKEVAVADECYNMSDQEMEMFLASVPNASRVVFIGDPNQIRPIPGETGAGTPALDIARAFPQHVIYLDQNMRQREDAKAIHECVTAIRLRLPRSIVWGKTINDGRGKSDPVVLIQPNEQERNHTSQAFKDRMFEIIERLRKNIHSEHDWQIITLYNGSKPNSPANQMPGVKQLNEVADLYLEHSGFFDGKRNRSKKNIVRHQITKNLVMFVGMKFIVTERFVPDTSITQDGQLTDPNAKPAKAPRGAEERARFNADKKAKREREAEARKLNESQGRSSFYDETKNGQIEIIQKIQQIPVPGGNGRSKAWVVTCEPKGKCSRGSRILISKAFHVDPAHVFPAWAVTSNKSMGGECKNVAVVLPPETMRSPFDNSHLYVMCSRPMEWLAVFGKQSDFDALVMKDPPRINSGLSIRLQSAKLVPEDQQGQLGLILKDADLGARLEAVDWKTCHNIEAHGHIDPELVESFGNIYDQRRRKAFPAPTPVCPTSYLEFRQERKKEYYEMQPNDRRVAVDAANAEWEESTWKYETPLAVLRLTGKDLGNRNADTTVVKKVIPRRPGDEPEEGATQDVIEDHPDDQREEEEHEEAMKGGRKLEEFFKPAKKKAKPKVEEEEVIEEAADDDDELNLDDI